MSFQASALLLAWVALAFLALALTGLIRQVRHLSERIAVAAEGGVDGGQSIQAAAVGSTPQGVETLASRFDGSFAVVFASESCGSCEERLKELNAASSSTASSSNGRLPLIIVRRSEAPAVGESELLDFETIQAPNLFTSFQVTITPMAYMVDEKGEVTEAFPLGSRDAVDRLVATLRGS